MQSGAPSARGPCWMLIWAAIFGRWNERSWQALLGVSVLVCSAMWDVIPDLDKVVLGLQPLHLLWLLNWMREYNSLEAHAAWWHVDRKTFAKRVAQMMDVLLAHLDVIHLEARLDDGPALFNLGYIVLDAVLCPVEVDRKVWANQKPFFSPKHGCHGLKYELAVHWRTGRIVWIAGPAVGSMHDLTISRQSGILTFLQTIGEYGFADKGYIGEPVLLCPFKGRWEDLPADQQTWNGMLNPHRTIVENALARVTKFNILQHKYRGYLLQHPRIFQLCANIAQLDILDNPLRADELECPERHHWFSVDEE